MSYLEVEVPFHPSLSKLIEQIIRALGSNLKILSHRDFYWAPAALSLPFRQINEHYSLGSPGNVISVSRHSPWSSLSNVEAALRSVVTKGPANLTWGPQAIMFINIRKEIRRNDRLSAAQ